MDCVAIDGGGLGGAGVDIKDYNPDWLIDRLTFEPWNQHPPGIFVAVWGKIATNQHVRHRKLLRGWLLSGWLSSNPQFDSDGMDVRTLIIFTCTWQMSLVEVVLMGMLIIRYIHRHTLDIDAYHYGGHKGEQGNWSGHLLNSLGHGKVEFQLVHLFFWECLSET